MRLSIDTASVARWRRSRQASCASTKMGLATRDGRLDGESARGRCQSSRLEKGRSPVAGSTRPEPTDQAHKEVITMSVLDRAALEASPLADLHAIASELSIDGYRRLRRPELIDAILPGKREPSRSPPTKTSPSRPRPPKQGRRRTGRTARARSSRTPRSWRRRSRKRSQPAKASRADAGAGADGGAGAAADRRGGRGSRARRARKPARRARKPTSEGEEAAEDEAGRKRRSRPRPRTIVEGMVELLANGSGFVRVDPPEPSDDDVYISAAQVKRCELVSGDRVTGPRRAAAPLRAVRVDGPDRHDQRRARRGGRRQRALRGSAGRVPGRALPARLRGPDDQGDRVV